MAGSKKSILNLNPSEQSSKVLVSTRTGEPYQPARIYYQVFNPKTVLGVFKKLRCMNYVPQQKRWQWLYDHEAKKLKFDISYNKIEKEYRPIVLGDFYFRGDQEMILDVRSFDRVLQAIEFFQKRINPRAACITRLRVVNRYFDGNAQDQDVLQPPFDHFFERSDVYIPDPTELEQKVQSLEQEYDNPEDRMAALNQYFEEKNKTVLPEIEEIPYYADEAEYEVDRLRMSFTLRNIQALNHWNGNTRFTTHDAIEQALAAMPNDLFEEDLFEEGVEAEQETEQETEQTELSEKLVEAEPVAELASEPTEEDKEA